MILCPLSIFRHCRFAEYLICKYIRNNYKMFKKFLYESKFNRIFLAHYSRLYMYAYHLTEDADLSRDIVGDVFMSLWDKISQIKEDGVGSYLTSSVRNACMDYFRHSQIVVNYSQEYLHMADIFYSDYSEALREDILVGKMLDALPEKSRRILESCYWEHKTYKEVAEEMGISPNTVKKHITHSYKMLRELFASREDEDSLSNPENKTNKMRKNDGRE